MQLAEITPSFFNPILSKMQSLGLKESEVKKEISFAVQAIRRSAQLQKCDASSVMEAVVNIANTGLSLNPTMKLAYLVPRWNAALRMNEACLEPDYRGLVKVLTDTGSVSQVNTQLVYKEDFFELDATNWQKPIVHKPKAFGDRGELVGVYSIALLPSGMVQYETMTVVEINEIRGRSESWKAFEAGKVSQSPWHSDYGEMCRKTVIRRLVKYLPKSEAYERVAKVIALDEADFKPSESALQYAYDLINGSDIQEDKELEHYMLKVKDASSSELSAIIAELKDRQVDNYIGSMGQVNKMVDDAVARDDAKELPLPSEKEEE